MPITFEQPQPVAPGVSAAYGATEQLSKDLPAIASVYQRNAAMQQQAAEHAQALQAQINMQGQALGERRLELQQHGMDQAAQFATSRLPSERDAFQAQAEQAAQNNRAANAAWLNQQQMSQQEQMDLRRRQDAVGYINQQMEAGQLTEDEGNSMIGRLRTGIDRDKMRLEQQQVEHSKKQDQLIDAQLRKQAEHEETNRQFQAQMLKDGKSVVMWTDDNGRRHPLIKNEKTGEWYNPLQSSHEVTARLEAARLDAQNKVDLQREDRARAEYMAKEKQAEDLVQKWAAQTTGDKNTPMFPELQDATKFRKAVAEQLAHATKATDIKDYVRQHAPRRGDQGGGGGGDYGATAPAAGGQAAPSPAEQKYTAENKPFAVEKWATEATTEQKRTVERWNQMSKAAESATQNPEQLRGYRESARWAVRALATYGSFPAMPPQVRDQYLKITNAMAPLIAPPAAPRPAASAPAAAGGYEGGFPSY